MSPSKKDLAALLDIKPKTIDSWLAGGLPKSYERREGSGGRSVVVFDLGEVLKWLSRTARHKYAAKLITEVKPPATTAPAPVEMLPPEQVAPASARLEENLLRQLEISRQQAWEVLQSLPPEMSSPARAVYNQAVDVERKAKSSWAETERALGNVVSRAEVEQRETEQHGAVAADLLAYPHKIAPLVVGQTDYREVVRLLRAGIKDVMRHLASGDRKEDDHDR